MSSVEIRGGDVKRAAEFALKDHKTKHSVYQRKRVAARLRCLALMGEHADGYVVLSVDDFNLIAEYLVL